MMSLAIPIIVLYEISIWSAKLVEKKRAEREQALDEELKKD
jgi:sec-independent protein translocase protein TatC